MTVLVNISYIELGVAVAALITISYLTSDHSRQFFHDLVKATFSKNDDRNARSIRRSVHWFCFWRHSKLTSDVPALIIGFVALIVGIFGFVFAEENDVLVLVSGLITAITFAFFAIDYARTTKTYESEFGGGRREYVNKFDGTVLCEGRKLSLGANDRYRNVSAGKSSALWDETIAQHLSQTRHVPFKLSYRDRFIPFARTYQSRKILKAYGEWQHTDRSSFFNLFQRYQDAISGLNKSPKQPVKTFTNDRKIRVDSLELTLEGRLCAKLSNTDYYTSQVTNVLSGKLEQFPTLKGRKKPQHMSTALPIIEIKNGDYVVQDLGGIEHLSNHIGGVHFSISSDGFPLLGFQNLRAAVGAGTVVFCGAGSADWGDIALAREFDGRDNFMQILRHAHSRELLEETGSVLQDSVKFRDQSRIAAFAMSRAKILGHYRNINWAGLPIFFGISQHDIDYETYREQMRVRKKAEFAQRDYSSSDVVATREEIVRYERLELEIVDYMSVFNKHAIDVKPIKSAEQLIEWIDILLPKYIELVKGEYVIPETSEKVELKLNDQIFIVRNILQQSESARGVFNKFYGG